MSTKTEPRLIGILGLERMNFNVAGREHTFGFGSNFNAFQYGAGGVLFLHWMKRCDFGLVLGGSADTHRILKSQRWLYNTNVRYCRANRNWSPGLGASRLKRLAGTVLRMVQAKSQLAERARQLAVDGHRHVEAIEEQRFVPDLLPAGSPFRFRFSPGVDHMNWRYNTRLDFVRYRLFRIVDCGRTEGYVVINEKPTQLFVAQCDAADALTLVYGICAALSHVDNRNNPRESLLTSSNPIMQQALREVGFRLGQQVPMAIGGLRGRRLSEEDFNSWLVNYDWGDNGLRAPFIGQPKSE